MVWMKILIGKILYKIDIGRQNKCDRLSKEYTNNSYVQDIIDWERRWKLPIDIYVSILDDSTSHALYHQTKYKDTKYESEMSVYYRMSYKYFKIVKNRLKMLFNLIFYFRDYRDY